MYAFFKKVIYPINPSTEAIDNNKQTKEWLEATQYTVLGMGLYALYSREIISASVLFVSSLYLEKLAAKFFDEVKHDQTKSIYIKEHYSRLTQFSFRIQPAIEKVTQVVKEEINKVQKK